VLVIEDNAEQREVYSSLLYYNGFDVDQAPTAEDALLLTKYRKPDVVLTDVRLPGIDGMVLAQTLKADPLTADTPVICISAYDYPPAIAKRYGADDFLRKPLTGDMLVRSIRRLIGWDNAPAYKARGRALIIFPRESQAALYFASALRELGFEISRAADGAAGLGIASVVNPRLVVVDLNLPVLDGWALRDRIRTISGLTDTPVCAYSAVPSPEERIRALTAGFSAYFEGGEGAEEIRAGMRKLLEVEA
jgi:putative two-component system response regulator